MNINPSNVLIVEDDKEIHELLCELLCKNGYKTTSAFTGLDALTKIRSGKFDMILLDLMLPYKSGDEILREVRRHSDVPVIVISAKDMVQTKIDMLHLGADDYITKPFDIDEVLARIETALRRYNRQMGVQKTLAFKDMVVDTESKTVAVAQKPLSLTVKEYQILELLLQNPKKVFSKQNLFESVWKEQYSYDDKTVNTHMSNLRNKLKKASPDEEYIETVWGIGYKLCVN